MRAGSSRSPLDFYRTAVVGVQIWNMFDTIPILHALDVRVEGESEAGEKIMSGCILPGFGAYPKPEKARYYNAFYRLLLTNEYVAYRDAYLKKMAQTLPARQSSGMPIRWSIVTDQEYTRNLFYIRRDGQISVLSSHTFDLANPAGNGP